MGYEIVQHGTAIRCLQCGVTSFNQNDVAKRYCARCGIFHDDYIRAVKDVYKPKRGFTTGETIQRNGQRYRVVDNMGFFGRVRDKNGVLVFPFFWFSEGEWCLRVEDK